MNSFGHTRPIPWVLIESVYRMLTEMLYRFHDFSTVSSDFAKDLCLILKNGDDGINRVACIELFGEGMINQAVPRLSLVVLESSVEEVLMKR